MNFRRRRLTLSANALDSVTRAPPEVRTAFGRTLGALVVDPFPSARDHPSASVVGLWFRPCAGTYAWIAWREYANDIEIVGLLRTAPTLTA